MEVITKEITVDLYGPTLRYAMEAHQGDRRTRVVLITVTEDGQPYELPTGAEFIAQIRKPNGVTVYKPCTVEDDKIKLVLPGNALDKKGRATCEIVFNEAVDDPENAQTLTTQAFEIEIHPKQGAANSIEHSDDLPSMEDQLAAHADQIAEQEEMIALQAKKIKALQEDTAQAVNGAEYDEAANELHLYHNGEDIENSPFTVSNATGGGGGGGAAAKTYTISLTNATTAADGSLTTVINVTPGADVWIDFVYLSQEKGNESNNDGAGTAQLIISGATQAGTYSVPQGVPYRIRLTDKLAALSGDVRVGVRVTNTEGSTKTMYWTASITAFSAETNFEDGIVRGTSFAYPWKLIGGDGTNLEKTPHFVVDGVELEALAVPTKSNAQKTSTVTAANGGHVLEFYGTAVVNGATIKTDVLKHAIIVNDGTSQDTAVAIMCSVDKCTQGDVLTFTFQAHDPANTTADVTIYADGSPIHSANVERTQQKWATRDYPAGTVTFKIVCGTAEASCVVEIEALEMDIEKSTNYLKMALDAGSYSTANPMKLISDVTDDAGENTVIEATLEGFGSTDTVTRMDTNGDAYITFQGTKRMTIPCYPFEENPAASNANGLTLEFTLNIHDVTNPDAKVITCLYENGNNRRGVYITASEMLLLSANMTDSGGEDAETNEYGSATDAEAAKCLRAGIQQDLKRRVSLVICTAAGNRMIYVYLDGVPTYCKQYRTGDDFSQATPSKIIVGSDEAAVDFYALNYFDVAQDTAQQLTNWIADLPTAADKQEAYTRNNLTTAADLTGDLSYEKCVAVLPCATVEIDQLPNDTSSTPEAILTMVNLTDVRLSFGPYTVVWQVQGTSTVVFPVKNWKGKGDQKISIDGTSRPVSVVCFKKDYMESSGSFNSGNCALISSLYRYGTPAVEHDWGDGYKAREAVTGYHCLLFQQKPGSTARTFIGRYFVMPDKSNPEHWGFDSTELPSWAKCQAWEFNANNARLCSFNATMDDFNADADEKPTSSLKSRYTPDGKKDHWDELKPLYAWMFSVDPAKATGDAFDEAVTITDGTWVYSKTVETVDTMPEEDVAVSYDADARKQTTTVWKQTGSTITKTVHAWTMTDTKDYTFEADTADYRRRKFHAEVAAHFDLEHLIVYPVYGEYSLSVDSFEKNMQLVTWDGVIWYVQMYDNDSSWGRANTGRYKFRYSAEFLDSISSGHVFNGYTSVLWNLVYDVLEAELDTRYAELRTVDNTLGYAPLSVEAVMTTIYGKFAGALPEIVQAADGDLAYVQPLLGNSLDATKNGKDYTYAQSGKARDLLYAMASNRTAYLDGKRQAASWLTSFAYMRVYNPTGTDDADTLASMEVVPPVAKSTVTMFDDAYPGIMFGRNTTIYTERVLVAENDTFTAEVTGIVNDKETFWYGGKEILDLGDLSQLYGSELDVSRLPKLRVLNYGNGTAGYCNKNALDLTVGTVASDGTVYACVLLEDMNVQNLPNMATINGMEYLTNLKYFRGKNSGVTQFHPAEGAPLTTVELPKTVTDLKLIGLRNIETFTAESWANVQMLWADGCVNVPLQEIVEQSVALDRVFLKNVAGYSTDDTTLRKLLNCRGWDETGATTNTAYVTGTWTLERCNATLLEELNAAFPYLTITAKTLTHTVTFANKDGSKTLNTQEIADGKNAVNPAVQAEGDPNYVSADALAWPTDATTVYSFIGWDGSYTNVKADVTVYALYRETPRRYTVQYVVEGEITHEFTGHNEINADGSVNTETTGIVYGDEAIYPHADPEDPTGEGRYFTGWLPEPDVVTGDMVCVAQFESTLTPATGITFEDATWGQINQIMKQGLVQEFIDKSVWWTGAGKDVTLKDGTKVRLELADVYHDTHADTGEKVPISLISENCMPNTRQWNNSSRNFYQYTINGTAATSADQSVDYTGEAGTVRIVSKGKAILSTITVTPADGSAETVWSFDNEAPGDFNFTGKVEGETTEWEGLTIDATQGKLEYLTTEGFAWFTSGCVLTIPVTGPCTIRVTNPFPGNCWNNGGWACADLKARMDKDGEFFKLLPYSIRKMVVPIVKVTTTGNMRTTVRASRNWLWLPTVNEVNAKWTTAGYVDENSDPYPIFTDNASRIKLLGEDGAATFWYLASPYTGHTNGVAYVYTGGDPNGHNYAGNWWGVPLGLCIAGI